MLLSTSATKHATLFQVERAVLALRLLLVLLLSALPLLLSAFISPICYLLLTETRTESVACFRFQM